MLEHKNLYYSLTIDISVLLNEVGLVSVSGQGTQCSAKPLTRLMAELVHIHSRSREADAHIHC